MTDPNTWARVILDSAHPVCGTRLTTMELNYPLIVHPEFMTHRVFSRNAASQRAIPTTKIIEQVKENPFIPTQWPLEQKGMVPAGFQQDFEEARVAWLKGRDAAVATAERLAKLGVHKQIATRPMTPYMYIRVLVSSTEWDNFLALRTESNAQHEIQLLANAIGAQLYLSKPVTRAIHFPYFQGVHEVSAIFGSALSTQKAAFISAGRCARVSYLTHNGEADVERDYKLGTRLARDGHMSPFEHVAYIGEPGTFYGNFRAWKQFRKTLPNEAVYQKESTNVS